MYAKSKNQLTYAKLIARPTMAMNETKSQEVKTADISLTNPYNRAP